MFCQLFSLQNKSFLCLQYVENKGFQTVIKHRLKAIQKPIKNELGNREKKYRKCTFRFEKMHISFSRLYNGSSFSQETTIDFQKQTFKAVLDLSSCQSTTTHENVLSIGNDLQDAKGWGGSGIYVIHMFYTSSEDSLQINCFNGTAQLTHRKSYYVSKEVTI